MKLCNGCLSYTERIRIAVRNEDKMDLTTLCQFCQNDNFIIISFQFYNKRN